MLKRRAISVGVILTLAAEIILGSVTSYGVQYPLPEKPVNVDTTSRSSAFYTLNDIVKAVMDRDKAQKALKAPNVVSPTGLPNFQEKSKDFTKMASSVVAENNNKQSGSVSLTDLQKVDNRRDKKELIVKYKDLSQSENTKKKLGAKKTKLSFRLKHSSKKLKMETIEISDESELNNVIDELKKDPNVEYAQPNYKLDLMAEPSDERFNEQWGLQNSGQTISGQAGTAGVDINVKNAWSITKGSEEVKVAVIDTGIDINHPDLAASIYKNPNEHPNGLDNDGNGYVSDFNGWNFVSDCNNVFSSEADDAHGTHVAGIIAAGINNGGVVGVAPEVKIVPLKFISGNTGYTSDAIEAIEYCQKMNISIANCSWGGPDYNPCLKDAMEKSGILFICAAGNSGKNIDNSPVYPASYMLPNIITVSANDGKGQLASFSNFGAKADVSAPGLNILSALPDNKYGYLSGTSMAAPFVTGTAALLKSSNESLSAADIKARILNNVSKSSYLSGKVSTSGRLNAYAALTNQPPQESSAPVVTETPTPENNNKSKEPQKIYGTTLEDTGKKEKPLVGENNLFVDALINKGISNASSNENGINNLSINKMKGNFVSVSWTTEEESTSTLYYGANGSLDKTKSDNEFTTKHQLMLKVDDMTSFSSYKVSSTTKDG
ncbi:MAG: S8 family peptidase, partial [Bacillota bacterium]|nr:S8 family peptidase [Bacillota bacterium]